MEQKIMERALWIMAARGEGKTKAVKQAVQEFSQTAQMRDTLALFDITQSDYEEYILGLV